MVTGGYVGADYKSGGKDAQTRFTLLERLKDSTYAEAELVTGRTHQIRVHAAHRGMPIAGDDRYADPAARRKLRCPDLRRRRQKRPGDGARLWRPGLRSLQR